MKATRDWHRTPFGRLALSLGGLELAVPVMVLVAAGLAWGTYLDSTYGATVAKARVYGSWWFLGLMLLVCVSLVMAVVTRFPWKRRHVGFITVHASLITLIAGGFWSLFGRVEGRLMLQEGTAGAAIETEDERVELLDHAAGGPVVIASAPAHEHAVGPRPIDLGGVPVTILERWANTHEEQFVADNGAAPLRAVEISFDPNARDGAWVGEDPAGAAATIQGVQVRVLPAGAVWEPPPATTAREEGGFAFVIGDQRFPLGADAAEGGEAVPGWTVASIRRFSSAIVSGGGLAENAGAPANPAVEVTISDGRGSTERHTAFLNFPDMVMGRTLEGSGKSGAQLRATPPGGSDSLVVFGDPPGLRVGYVGADGSSRVFEHAGPMPFSFDAGARRVTILKQFTRARADSRFVPAPPASERRPALLVRVGEVGPVVAPWKGVVPVTYQGRDLMVRYGPRTVPLPFEVRLDDFRKTDYPGTEMAMAYESDVTVSIAGRAPRSTRIYMNNPFVFKEWKVYQSGFSGDQISIFSVMRDPGIPMTYAGCLGLVVGIIVTFYSRTFSWGHPGIAVPFAREEKTHAAPGVDREPVAAGVGAGGSGAVVDSATRVDPDPGRGPGHAPGHVRAAAGGAADRAVPVGR